MPAASALAVGGANSGTAKACGRKRNFLRTNSLVMQKARSLSPLKTAEFIAEITGRPVRTVEYWLSTERLPGEAIGALIQSEHGLEFVAAIADAARPAWWRKVRRALAMSDEKLQRVREAQNAATELAAAIARATVAAGVSLEELDRVAPAAIVEAAPRSGVPGRPVAAPPRGPR